MSYTQYRHWKYKGRARKVVFLKIRPESHKGLLVKPLTSHRTSKGFWERLVDRSDWHMQVQSADCQGVFYSEQTHSISEVIFSYSRDKFCCLKWLQCFLTRIHSRFSPFKLIFFINSYSPGSRHCVQHQKTSQIGGLEKCRTTCCPAAQHCWCCPKTFQH